MTTNDSRADTVRQAVLDHLAAFKNAPPPGECDLDNEDEPEEPVRPYKEGPCLQPTQFSVVLENSLTPLWSWPIEFPGQDWLCWVMGDASQVTERFIVEEATVHQVTQLVQTPNGERHRWSLLQIWCLPDED